MIDQPTKVIAPVAVTDAMLVSSTAPESDYPVWAAATTYTIGQRCIRPTTHRIYERTIAGVSAKTPETDATNWLDVGPTNRWAMFDDVIGTRTSVPSFETPLSIVVKPGSVSGLALLDVVGRVAIVTLKSAPSGSVVYSREIDLDGTIIDSIYDWFYQPFQQKSIVALTDLPFHYPFCELSVSISATFGPISCGVLKVGEVVGLGSSEYGATSGIIDYSTKTVDTFGITSITRRGYAKRMSLKVMTEKSEYNRISRELSSLRAVPAVWIATDAYGYEPLTVYGFFKDFSIDVAYPTMHYCSIEIEGLI